MPATRATKYAHMKSFKCVHGHKRTQRFLQWKETFLELINVFEHCTSSDPDTESSVSVKPNSIWATRTDFLR